MANDSEYFNVIVIEAGLGKSKYDGADATVSVHDPIWEDDTGIVNEFVLTPISVDTGDPVPHWKLVPIFALPLPPLVINFTGIEDVVKLIKSPFFGVSKEIVCVTMMTTCEEVYTLPDTSTVQLDP